MLQIRTPEGRTDAIRVIKSLQSGMDPKHIPSKIIECSPLGPLSSYIDSYVRLLNEEGYALSSVRDHVRVIVRFSRSLQRSDCQIRDLDEAIVERFLHHKPKSHLHCVEIRDHGVSHGPRLHDFRHRFAVETLLSWYRNGEQLIRRMPVPSTYMGHGSVTGTYWYLSNTPELMTAASESLEARWKGVLP